MMEDLHAAIARFLRAQRPAAARATPEPPVPAVRRQRAFVCRFCGGRVWEDEPGELFHFNELWEVVSCAACHRERLRLEARPGGAGAVLRQVWQYAPVLRPRCRKCGALIRDGGATGYDVAELHAARACADCYTPF